jgi:hypothetical protein
MSLHTLTLRPNNVWSWSLGHFYLRDDLSTAPTSLGIGNNLLTSLVFYRLNEDWAVSASHYFEARTGTLQEQAYTIYRDLRSWTLGVTFRARENPGGPEDIGAAVVFSFKAYPSQGLYSETRRPNTLWSE